MNTAALGQWGEHLAQEHYRASGYLVVRKNYRCRYGEIDLICEKDGVLVFSEVKTRGEGTIARPGAWVGPQKQCKIINAARQYLYERQLSEPPLRFDVVEILVDKGGGYRICVTENAFSV